MRKFGLVCAAALFMLVAGVRGAEAYNYSGNVWCDTNNNGVFTVTQASNTLTVTFKAEERLDLSNT